MNSEISADVLQKYARLKAHLASFGSVAVAFSSGVDSTFLLHAAKEALGDNAIAVTAASCSFPVRELNEAKAFCEKEGIRQFILESNELAIEGFSWNPKNRCYLCKRALFTRMLTAAAEHGVAAVAEGSNVDDMGDYRPGLQAIAELGVRSPLRAAGLTKAEIRELSRELGLPTWEKPSFACLASRFVYGEEITREKLSMVEASEEFLRALGLRQLRVRVHGMLARIEAEPSEIARLAAPELREKISAHFRALGFQYVALDLEGYRTGKMNRALQL